MQVGLTSQKKIVKKYLDVMGLLQEQGVVSGKYGNRVPDIIQRIDENEKECGVRLYRRYAEKTIGVGIIGARVLPKRWVARKP